MEENKQTSDRTPAPTILVIFGASGDLTARKLVPALYNLGCENLLPEHFHLIGYGRSSMTDDAFRDCMKKAVSEYSRSPFKDDLWNRLSPNFSYHAGPYDDLDSFRALSEKIKEIEDSKDVDFQCLFYVSTPPGVFKPILENLGNSGLARRHRRTAFASKVVVEKPFGRDLETACELNAVITRRFEESQVFRIDHYLGKAPSGTRTRTAPKKPSTRESGLHIHPSASLACTPSNRPTGRTGSKFEKIPWSANFTGHTIRRTSPSGTTTQICTVNITGFTTKKKERS